MSPNIKTNIPKFFQVALETVNQESPAAEDPLQYSVQVFQTMKQSPFQFKVSRNNIFFIRNFIEKGYRKRNQMILERILSSSK